jgi:hypothetical protein
MLDFDNTFGTIEMYCDKEGCHESQMFEGFDGHCDLQAALKEAREYGWKIFREDGEWVHYCPLCSENS